MKNFTKAFLIALAVSFFALTAAQLGAQMVSPKIDQTGEAFSYYSKPTDEIGMMDAEAATEITPEGYLRTGFGELMFFTGPELEPTSARIRILAEGHLPILEYNVIREDSLSLHDVCCDSRRKARGATGELYSSDDEE